jgi:hypothetical protein
MACFGVNSTSTFIDSGILTVELIVTNLVKKILVFYEFLKYSIVL